MTIKSIVTNIWYQVLDDCRVQIQDLDDGKAVKNLNNPNKHYRCFQQKDVKFVNCTFNTIDHGWSISLDSCHVKKVNAVGYVLLKNCKDIEVESQVDVLAQDCENVKIKARNVYLFDTLKAELTVAGSCEIGGSEKTRPIALNLKVARIAQQTVQGAGEEAKKS